MATGIQAGGTDLDSLFMALISTKISDVGWQSNGSVDISNRFEPYQGGTKVATTNLQDGTVDLADLFQKLGENFIGADWPESQTTFEGHKNNTAVALCYFYARDDGTYDWVLTDGTNVTGDFLNTTGVDEGVGYWVKWVKNSGDSPSGGTMSVENTYYQITSGSDQDFFLSMIADDTALEGNFTITIAEDASGTNAVSWTGSMRASQGSAP